MNSPFTPLGKKITHDNDNNKKKRWYATIDFVENFLLFTSNVMA